MQARVLTLREELTLKIMVKTLGGKSRKICIIVSDGNQRNTVFTNRYKVFKGIQTFYVRLPLSPEVALVTVYDEETGDKDYDRETSFEMVNEDGDRDNINFGIYKLPLEKNVAEVDLKKTDVRTFVNFAESFAYHAGIWNTGNYASYPFGRIKFKYVPTIYRKDGAESNTPARIDSITKVIEISQKIFIPYTVPMRFAVLCHEFAHCYLNATPADEIEADLQGLNIYLSLGFPHIEAYEAWLETFIGAPSQLNGRRYAIVDKYIKDFSKQKVVRIE